MGQTDIIGLGNGYTDMPARRKAALAAGLFGYSIGDGQVRSFKPTEGYLRDIEQMPNFAPPSVSNFVAQYMASHMGKTRTPS